MEAWREYMSSTRRAERHNNINHGMSYSAPPRSVLTIDAVREYMAGFGWDGVGAREVAEATGRVQRGVQAALAELDELGEVRYLETPTTLGGSLRKQWYTNQGRFVPIPPATMVSTFFTGSSDEHQPRDGTPGGGRKVAPLPGAD